MYSASWRAARTVWIAVGLPCGLDSMLRVSLVSFLGVRSFTAASCLVLSYLSLSLCVDVELLIFVPGSVTLLVPSPLPCFGCCGCCGRVVWVSLPLRPVACCCLCLLLSNCYQLFRCIMSLGLRVCWLCLLLLVQRIIVATFLFWMIVVRARVA